VVLVIARTMVACGHRHRDRGDDGERRDQGDRTARTRCRLGEERLHVPTIAARSSLCSRKMATRAARSKPTPKPGAAATPTPPPAVHRDTRDIRRWIYGGLDGVCAIVYAIAIWKVIPNRLPSAAVHLWSLPLAALAMAAGTLRGGPKGWWIAVLGGSAMLLSVFLLIVRILISAVFLAGRVRGVRQGRGDVLPRDGRARDRARRAVADRAGQVSDDARGPACVRHAGTMKRRTIALVCVWTVPSLVFVAVTAIVYAAFRIAPPDPTKTTTPARTPSHHSSCHTTHRLDRVPRR